MTSSIAHNNLLKFFLILLCMLSLFVCQQDDFEINENDYSQDQQKYQEQNQAKQRRPSQQQMQYFSQRRTACLVLSRYYLNQYSQSINDIVKDLEMGDKNTFINKLYASAIEKCEPLISEMEVVQFFTPNNDQFDPSKMFHIFDGYNFYEISNDLGELTPNQKAITKFIKDFDDEMQVRKEEQEAQKNVEERDQGIQLFFISLKSLPPQMKYLYVVLVILISAVILWYGFSQIGQQPVKKQKKKAKKQQ